MIIARTPFSSEFMPDGGRGQYCVSAVTDTLTISCAKEQTEKAIFKSVGAKLKTVGFSLRTLYKHSEIARAGHNWRQFDESTMNLSIDIVNC
jgi:hypothetical protein